MNDYFSYAFSAQEVIKELLEKPENKELLELKLKEYLSNTASTASVNKLFDRFLEYNYTVVKENINLIIKEVVNDKKSVLQARAVEILMGILEDSKMFTEILRQTFSSELYQLANLAVEKSVNNRKKIAAKKKASKNSK